MDKIREHYMRFFYVDKTFSHLIQEKIYLRDFYIKKFRHKICLQSFSQQKNILRKNVNKVEVEIQSNKKVINFWKKNKFTIKSLKYSLNI